MSISLSVGSVLNQGLSGIQQSQREMLNSANEIVQAGTTQRDSSTVQDIAEPLIEMKIQQQVFDASANVVKVADDTLGTLLDVNA